MYIVNSPKPKLQCGVYRYEYDPYPRIYQSKKIFRSLMCALIVGLPFHGRGDFMGLLIIKGSFLFHFGMGGSRLQLIEIKERRLCLRHPTTTAAVSDLGMIRKSKVQQR